MPKINVELNNFSEVMAKIYQVTDIDEAAKQKINLMLGGLLWWLIITHFNIKVDIL